MQLRISPSLVLYLRIPPSPVLQRCIPPSLVSLHRSPPGCLFMRMQSEKGSNISAFNLTHVQRKLVIPSLSLIILQHNSRLHDKLFNFQIARDYGTEITITEVHFLYMHMILSLKRALRDYPRLSVVQVLSLDNGGGRRLSGLLVVTLDQLIGQFLNNN